MNQTLPPPPISKATFFDRSRLVIGIAALGLLGFFDAAYLTAKHFLGGSTGCFLVEGCDIVTGSKYAEIAGIIPVALLGLLYYSAILVLAFLFYETGRGKWWQWATGLAGSGFLFSGWLFYLQVDILKAYCIYCLVSITTSTLIFILLGLGLITHRR